MTTTRALPPDEWFKLEGTLLEQAWPSFDPELDIVLVVEKDGVIVGCTSFLPRWHMEGTWIHPDHRSMVKVGRPLLNAMYTLAHQLKAKELIMVSVDPEVSAMCRRLGSSSMLMHGDHYSIGLGNA